MLRSRGVVLPTPGFGKIGLVDLRGPRCWLYPRRLLLLLVVAADGGRWSWWIRGGGGRLDERDGRMLASWHSTEGAVVVAPLGVTSRHSGRWQSTRCSHPVPAVVVRWSFPWIIKIKAMQICL